VVFAVAVTYSVSLAGIYVVFATLIITPLILGFLQGQASLVAALCAIAGHLSAIAYSVVSDVPVGPTIVVATLVMALLWLAGLRWFAGKYFRALRPEASGR